MTTPFSVARDEGERRRDAGMALAAERRQQLIWKSQLALLDAIRSREDRTSTTDFATDSLEHQYSDGGRWRGAVPARLVKLGLIRKVGVVSSARPSRHAGYLSVWQGIDDAAIDSYRAQLRACLASMPTPAESKPTEQRTLFDV